MEPITIAFYISMFLWLASEIYYAISLRSGSKGNKKDKYSFLILWIIIPLSISISTSVSTMHFKPIIDEEWISWIGISLILIGVLVRLVIIKSLGKYFTVDVNISDDHKMKTDGFYKIIRHPSYAFSLITFLGLGLAMDNWASFAIAIIPPFIAFSYRIFVEETALKQQFGQEYVNYTKHTKKIIPFIY